VQSRAVAYDHMQSFINVCDRRQRRGRVRRATRPHAGAIRGLRNAEWPRSGLLSIAARSGDQRSCSDERGSGAGPVASAGEAEGAADHAEVEARASRTWIRSLSDSIGAATSGARRAGCRVASRGASVDFPERGSECRRSGERAFSSPSQRSRSFEVETEKTTLRNGSLFLLLCPGSSQGQWQVQSSARVSNSRWPREGGSDLLSGAHWRWTPHVAGGDTRRRRAAGAT